MNMNTSARLLPKTKGKHFTILICSVNRRTLQTSFKIKWLSHTQDCTASTAKSMTRPYFIYINASSKNKQNFKVYATKLKLKT